MEKQRTGQTSFQVASEKNNKTPNVIWQLEIRKIQEAASVFMPGRMDCIKYANGGMGPEHSLSMRGNQSEGPADRDNNFD